MRSYRKRPIVVEAELFDPGCLDGWSTPVYKDNDWPTGWAVDTLHGPVSVAPGDYVVMEPDGKHAYPVAPDIFKATYDPVEE
jgi:hypothetical protein